MLGALRSAFQELAFLPKGGDALTSFHKILASCAESIYYYYYYYFTVKDTGSLPSHECLPFRIY